MHERSPYLLVRPLAGDDVRVDLSSERITIGRSAPGVRPDIVLEPDPQRWIGRIHCILENVGGLWSIADNATVNGTYLSRGGEIRKIIGQERLRHGDIVMILGEIRDGDPAYWQLRLVDPFRTLPAPFDSIRAPAIEGTPIVEYDWVEARLYRVDGNGRTEITGLTPKAHQLIRFMVDQNQRNGGAAVVCTHEHLKHALWGERDEWPAHRAYTDQDVRDVVYQARQRIETDGGAPKFLQTVRGLGYRLRSAPPPATDRGE